RHEPTKEDPYPYPRVDSQPNGSLKLEIKEYVDYDRKVWADGKKQRVEDQLGSFIVGLEQVAERLHERNEEHERREREMKAERAPQAELEARRIEEQKKIDGLLEQLSEWQKSEALRSFVATLRELALAKYGCVENGSELDKWMKWALRVARDLDPL